MICDYDDSMMTDDIQTRLTMYKILFPANLMHDSVKAAATWSHKKSQN